MNAPTGKIQAGGPMTQEVGLTRLRAEFPPNQISKLPKETRGQIDARKANKTVMVWKCAVCGGAHHKDAVHLDYVGHAALTDRLLDTDLEWSWEPVAFNAEGLPAFDKSGGLWIKLTVLGVTRLGYGSADGKSGGDAVKEVIGDALRNAAMRFGAALDLWHKGDLHLDEESGSDGGSGRDNSEARQVSPTGPTSSPQVDQRITDEQLVRIQMLLKATKIDEISFIREMGAPDGVRIFQMMQSKFPEAISRLEAKLASMAKAGTNTAGGFADITEDEIPY